jgi:N-hydroxyarylamine O-acetyltransferase
LTLSRARLAQKAAYARVWRAHNCRSGALTRSQYHARAGNLCGVGFELTSYLGRIGVRDVSPSLASVHRAHATTIVFENFDSSSGQPVALDVDSLADKMITRGRGGYCFEQNMLLKAALEAMDLGPIDLMLARVRIGGSGDDRALNHLVLRVRDGDRVWLADVGLGGGGLLDPVPFEVGVETDQEGWRYRLIEEASKLVLQVFQDDAWIDLYDFVPEPVPPIDVEVSNWYTATSPSSQFVNGVIVGRRSPDRCLSLFVFGQPAVLVERAVGAASEVNEVPLGAVPALLAQRFGIDGVTVTTDDRLSLTAAEHERADLPRDADA